MCCGRGPRGVDSGNQGSHEPVPTSPRVIRAVRAQYIVCLHGELRGQGSARRMEPKFEVRHACRFWRLCQCGDVFPAISAFVLMTTGTQYSANQPPCSICTRMAFPAGEGWESTSTAGLHAIRQSLARPREAGLIAVARQTSRPRYRLLGFVVGQDCHQETLSQAQCAPGQVRGGMRGSARCRRGTRQSEPTMLPATAGPFAAGECRPRRAWCPGQAAAALAVHATPRRQTVVCTTVPGQGWRPAARIGCDWLPRGHPPSRLITVTEAPFHPIPR